MLLDLAVHLLGGSIRTVSITKLPAAGYIWADTARLFFLLLLLLLS